MIRLEGATLPSFDLPRSPIRVLTTFADGSAPLTAAVGFVESADELTEDRIILRCRGRDAFLIPAIQPGLVTYLPGPLPSAGPAPIPADPCAPAPPPVVIPGEPPAEPEPGAPPMEGSGPEAPAAPPAEEPPAPATLVRLWTTFHEWHGHYPIVDTDLFSPLSLYGIASGEAGPPPPIVGPIIVETSKLTEGILVSDHPEFGHRQMWVIIHRGASVTGTRLRFNMSAEYTGTPGPAISSDAYYASLREPDHLDWYETHQDINLDETKSLLDGLLAAPESGAPYDLAVGDVRCVLLQFVVNVTTPDEMDVRAEATATMLLSDIRFTA